MLRPLSCLYGFTPWVGLEMSASGLYDQRRSGKSSRAFISFGAPSVMTSTGPSPVWSNATWFRLWPCRPPTKPPPVVVGSLARRYRHDTIVTVAKRFRPGEIRRGPSPRILRPKRRRGRAPQSPTDRSPRPREWQAHPHLGCPDDDPRVLDRGPFFLAWYHGGTTALAPALSQTPRAAESPLHERAFA
jgi:hypothetical protein